MTISGNTIAHEALVDQNARDYRRLIQRMLQGNEFVAAGGTGSGGVARSGDLLVAQRAAGANMSVDVAIGGALVGANSGATGYSATAGSWWGFNDAVLNIPISASDPVNARIDLIGIAFRDAEYAGATNDCQLTVITGTAAGVPAEPSIPATYHGWVTLARVDVAALAASIVNGNITDRRKRLSALGGVVPVANAADLAAITSPWEGLCAIDMANDIAYNYDGAAFVALGQYARAWSIITDTLNGGTATFDFTSIPQTFTHLELVLIARGNGAAASNGVCGQINNDGGALYDTTRYGWDSGAGAVGSALYTANTFLYLGDVTGNTATAARAGTARITAPHYRNTSFEREFLWASGTFDATVHQSAFSGGAHYRSTTAVSRITLSANAVGTGYLAGSRCTLIGIR